MRIDHYSLQSRLQTQTAKSKTGLDAADVKEREDKKLKEACKDFEALFLSSLMKAMRKTVHKTNLFGSDSGEQTFQEMMDVEISNAAARNSSMGIADMLYKQLKWEIAQKTPEISGDEQ